MDEHIFPDDGRKLRDMMVRFSERSINTYHLMERMEAHQREQNGFIREALMRSRVNRTLLSIGGSLILVLAGLVTKIGGIW